MAAMAEDARTVFSLIGRDLRLSITREDDIPGYNIRIHQPGPSELWFVSANESGNGTGASLIEVAYRLNGNTLERAEVEEGATDKDGLLLWNPYGDRNDASRADPGGFQPVIDGVMRFSLTCYDSQLMVLVLDQSSQSPTMVGVTISLLDGKSYQQWERLPEAERDAFVGQRARTFHKLIQIPGAQFFNQ